jgi:hypothetical protein
MMRFSANDQTVTGHARNPEETRMPTRFVPRLAWLAGAALLLAACGGTGPAAQPPSPATTIAASETTAEPDEGGTNQSGEGEGGCPARGPRPPGGRTIEADVDGDGAADQVWLAGGAKGARVGVTTNSGAGAELKTGTAKPPAVLGAEDANGDGRAEIFVRTAGTQGAQVVDHVTLAVWSGCRLRWVTNVQDKPYTFVVRSGNAEGDGVGCVDADNDGRVDLVGTHAERVADDQVRWTRTIVRLDGTRAVSGSRDSGTFLTGRDDARIETLVTATCGKNDFSDPLE